jgi:hypothetical protein
MSKLDKKNYLRILQTKFGDYPSIISVGVGDDVKRFISNFSFSGP